MILWWIGVMKWIDNRYFYQSEQANWKDGQINTGWYGWRSSLVSWILMLLLQEIVRLVKAVQSMVSVRINRIWNEDSEGEIMLRVYYRLKGTARVGGFFFWRIYVWNLGFFDNFYLKYQIKSSLNIKPCLIDRDNFIWAFFLTTHKCILVLIFCWKSWE